MMSDSNSAAFSQFYPVIQFRSARNRLEMRLCRSSVNAGSSTNEAEEEEGGVYFSDGDEGSRRSASPVEDDPSDCTSVDVESGEEELHFERECRICHMSLMSNGSDSEIAIELGCSCKDDSAAAHQHCAETWFKIKGNKTCEICNSIARNVVGPNDGGSENGIAASTNTAPSITENRRHCLNGHRLLNFRLACMVFAFVISWPFHFNLPS